MTDVQQTKGVQTWLTSEDGLTWMDENAPKLRRSVSGYHFLYWSLGIAFVIGLAAHIGGFVLVSSQPTGLVGLAGDLLHALGWSLWTGAVVVVFAEVIPEVKRRQIRQALDDYDKLRGPKGGV